MLNLYKGLPVSSYEGTDQLWTLGAPLMAGFSITLVGVVLLAHLGAERSTPAWCNSTSALAPERGNDASTLPARADHRRTQRCHTMVCCLFCSRFRYSVWCGGGLRMRGWRRWWTVR